MSSPAAPGAPPDEVEVEVDVCVVGSGQSALSLGYHLRRETLRRPGRPLSFVILDDRDRPGGAWTDGWDTLTLFSPAGFSSLAGWPMPAWTGEGTPSAAHVVDYLTAYEERHELPVRRPVRVTAVEDPEGPPAGRLIVRTDTPTSWSARVVVSATGTWSRPFWPAVAGADVFGGTQLHTADYRSAHEVPGRRVLVVGAGNSGAQNAADLLLHSTHEVIWCTRDEPSYLPDDVDGRVLFATAMQAVRDQAAGVDNRGVASLGDIVATPTVRRARDELGLRARPMLDHLTETTAVWADGAAEPVDTVVWCTGFRPALAHLRGLHLPREHGHPRTENPGCASWGMATGAGRRRPP